MSDIFIVSGARTAIGTFGGSLSGHTPVQLGTLTAKAVLERAGASPDIVDAAVYANVLATEPKDVYAPRVIAINTGVPSSSTALSVNRLCGSGAQAIVSATQMIRDGDATVALAGGAEVMSCAPYSIPGVRDGLRTGDGVVYDWLSGALVDPFGHGHMGVTAENVAEQHDISRERQDEFALESQARARNAIDSGRFASQIVPVEIRRKKETIAFETDEHPRESTPERIGKLKPAFKDGGSVTAGNASGMNDGAASVLLAGEEAVAKHGLTPQARIVSWGFAGVPPEIMGVGPIKAVPRALKKAGLTLDDMDLIESNEAFAAQAIAVQDALGFDPAKTNVDGGAVALGHPIGATGAILTVKMMHRLKATGGRYGLITMCIGGGQGIALIIEAV